MTLDKMSVSAAMKEVENLLKKEKHLSPALKAAIKILIVLMTMLVNRFGLNSKNSSKSPAEDKKRKRGSSRKKSGKKPGGQNGHMGTKLKKVADPDKIEEIKVDKRYLPKGQYREIGYESRQVFDIEISRVITEYRAQILEDQHGMRFVAEFPPQVKNAVQYGVEVKVNSVYMSQFQLLPYSRIQNQFADHRSVAMLAKDFRPSCPLKSARMDATSLLCFACRGRPRQLLLHSSRARTVSQMTLRWQIDFQHSLRSAENRQLPRTTRPRLRLSLARSV